MRQRFAAILLTVLAFLVPPSRAAETPAPLSLVPLPAHLALQSGDFTVTNATTLVWDADGAFAARNFAALIAQARGIRLSPQAGATRAIAFRHLADPDATGKEGYRLDVTPDGITVSASQPAGLYYGGITLWQLLTQAPVAAASATIPALGIDDAPRFAWRGLLLDSVRHFQTVDFIKTLIDAMSREKLNVLQWHLADDQGWRLEIKAYPRLTKIGAWRIPAGQPPQARYGGFYTQAQVRELVAYAAQRNITIVPEIEMPGHAMAAIVAYPWLGSIPHPPGAVSSDWGVFPYLYNPDDATFAFLQNVLTEVMALFPSPYIHVGGDEAVKDQWKANPRVQAKMRALGVKDENALQSWFIARIGTFLKSHGRRLIGWDEILDGGVPPDATITSWRGIDGAVTAAKAGHDAVLSPAPVLYFDNRQAEGPAEPSGRGGIVTLEQVYALDPAPAALDAAARAHIIGVQANVWTEHIREQDNVLYAAFPRAAAVAEIAWSPAASHDWASFQARMPAELSRYAALGLKADPNLVSPYRGPADPFTRDSHELKLCGNAIALSIEGPAATNGARGVFLHDIMNPCWIFEKVDLTGRTDITVRAGLLPFNFQIGGDAQKIVLPWPSTPHGELEAHLDTCNGPAIATLPMPAPDPNHALVSATGALTPQAGIHDVCLVFTRAKLASYWALASVALGRR